MDVPRRAAVPLLAAGFLSLLVGLLAGCAPAIYPYFVADDGCNCVDYSRRDGPVEYLFHAQYRMSDGVDTKLGITFINRSNDTLTLDLALIRITSRNISYQYNDKFIPLPPLHIAPHERDSVLLAGRDVSGNDDWHVIAGERLKVTIRGVKVGGRSMQEQDVTFVPENPKLRRERTDQ